jgi:hypothetical protein
MEKIVLNSLLKSTQKPYNQYLWLNIISATKEKRKPPKNDKWNEFIDDYIIEYKTVFKEVNSNNSVKSGFIYKSYLSEFAIKEQTFIRQLINLRSIAFKNDEIKNTVMAEVTVI